MRTIALIAFASLAACATRGFPAQTSDDVQLVPPKGLVEFSIDDRGRVQDVEFHCTADAIPEVIRAAAERDMPGGQITDCEKEYAGRKVRWEVTKKVGGRKSEVLYNAEGEAVEWETEVDPATVPANVLQAGDSAAPGKRTAVEEIRDKKRNLVAFHVKKQTADGFRYKVCLDTDGEVTDVFRETWAEIEIPVR